VRFRKGGFQTYLTGVPWSDDFMRQYAAALEGVKAQASNIGAARTVPGTINELIVSYYKLVFPLLKPSTQAMRRNILRPVEIHREFITAAARWMMAAKL
jgi:hypothetical protein